MSGTAISLLQFGHEIFDRFSLGILFSGVIVSVIAVPRVGPDFSGIVTDQEYQRRVIMERRNCLQFRHRLFAADHVKLLRLIVAGGRNDPSCFQDLIQFFLFNGPAVKVKRRSGPSIFPVVKSFLRSIQSSV